MLIETQVAQWTSINALTSMTWVQVPGLAKFHIIFQNKILCFANVQVHHAHSKINLHASIRSNPRAMTKGVSWTPVNMPYLIKKVNGLQANGPGFSNLHLTILGLHPTWFGKFVYFSYILHLF